MTFEGTFARIIAHRDWVWARLGHYHWGMPISKVASVLKMSEVQVANVLSGPLCDGSEASRSAAYIFALQLAVVEMAQRFRAPRIRDGALALALVADHYSGRGEFSGREIVKIAHLAGVVPRVASAAEVSLFHAGRLRGVSPEVFLGELLPPMKADGVRGFDDEGVERLSLSAFRDVFGVAGRSQAMVSELAAHVASEWFENIVSDDPVPSQWRRESIREMLPHYLPKTGAETRA